MIKQIQVDLEEISGFVPPEYIEEIDEKDLFLFVHLKDDEKENESEDESTPMGQALFSVSKSELNLIYIYVREEYRRQGIASDILKYAVKKLIGNTKDVSCECIVSRQDINNNNSDFDTSAVIDWLSHCGFKEAFTNYKIAYSIPDMADSALGDHIGSFLPVLQNVHSPNSISTDVLSDFCKSLKARYDVYELRHMDKDFTRFYLYQDEILGFINVEHPVQDVLILKDFFVKQKNESHLVPEVLLLDVIRISETLLSEDSVLIYKTHDKKQIQAMIHLFKTPLLTQKSKVYKRSVNTIKVK